MYCLNYIKKTFTLLPYTKVKNISPTFQEFLEYIIPNTIHPVL